MIKLLTVSAALSSMLWSYTAEIKKESVTLQINDTVTTFKAGETPRLNGGDIVCFVEGKGRVLLVGEGYKKQLTRHSRTCKQLPLSKTEDASKSYVNVAQEHIASFFADAKESEVSGVSLRNVTVEQADVKEIVVTPGTRFITLGGEKWGPLPVSLEILDDKGGVIETVVNDEDVPASFILKADQLQEGNILRVSNAFEDLLAELEIVIDSEKDAP